MTLLVVDEIGHLPISRTGAMLFFQLMTRRYERQRTYGLSLPPDLPEPPGSLCLAERVGFVPAILAPINDLGLIRSPQITKSTRSLSIRYKTGTARAIEAMDGGVRNATRGGGYATVPDMQIVGRVAQQWRYPVKSMKAEPLTQAFVGFAGVYGDRVYAFRRATGPKGFPFLTARQYPEMLQYGALFLNPDSMALPPNLSEAAALPPGATPLYADTVTAGVNVHAPAGQVWRVDDPGLVTHLADAASGDGEVTLLRSDRAFTDCRPLSLISAQTVQLLGQEVGTELDARRFRPNVYVELTEGQGYGEDRWVGRRLRLGATAEVIVLAKDPRCKMITLDPDTARALPDLMRCVSEHHEGTAGVYAAVVTEGTIRAGDTVAYVD